MRRLAPDRGAEVAPLPEPALERKRAAKQRREFSAIRLVQVERVAVVAREQAVGVIEAEQAGEAAEAVEDARREVLDHDVGIGDQRERELASGLRAEVQRDAPLPRVHGVEDRTALPGTWLVGCCPRRAQPLLPPDR